MEDERSLGRRSTWRTDDNAERVREVLNLDRRQSVYMIANQTDINKMTVHTIFTKNAEDLC